MKEKLLALHSWITEHGCKKLNSNAEKIILELIEDKLKQLEDSN